MTQKSKSLTQIALSKFKKNRSGLLSFWYIVFCAFVAVFAYVLAPDNTTNANQMHLEIHSKPPGFKVFILNIPSKIKEEQTFFDKWFFGKKSDVTEIPIESFVLKDRKSVV